jgi:hypothetical protein
MNVNTRFHLIVHITRLGTCDETPTFLNDRMHHLDKVEYDVIWKCLWTLVVKIDEKLENVSLLLDHVQFLACAYCMYTLYVKFFKLFKRNLKNSTIHKDVCSWTFVSRPFLHTVYKGLLF